MLKKILNESVTGYPWASYYDREKCAAEFEKASAEFANILKNKTKANWDLAFVLADIVERGLYRSYYDEYTKLSESVLKDNGSILGTVYAPVGGVRSVGNPAVLLVWAREKFGLSRTSVYSMLEVVDEFAFCNPENEPGERYSINAEAREFSFGQLVEMVPIPYKDRIKIQPNWTREMIRAYKKELEAFKNRKVTVPPAEQVEELKPVVSERYLKYSKFSKKDLVDLVCQLEDVIDRQKAKIEAYESEGKSDEDDSSLPEYEQMTI